MTRKPNLHTLALWASLPMARTAQVESRLKMILKPNASRRALTRRAALWPAAQVQSDAAPTAWKQTLPNGVTVELLGVSNEPTKLNGGGWWRPDGSLLAGSPFGGPLGNPVAGRDRRAFALRVTPPSDQRPEEYSSPPQYEVPGANSVSVNYAMVSSNSLRMRGLDVVSAGADALPTPGTVRCGVAAGAWETLTSQYVIPASAAMKSVNLRYQSTQVDIIFSRMTEFGGNAAVTVTTTLLPSLAEWRVLAIGTTGKVYTDTGIGERLSGSKV